MNELHEAEARRSEMREPRKPRRMRNRALAAGLLATTMLAGGFGFSAWSAETPAPANTNAPVNAHASIAPTFAESGFAPLVQKVRPAVVNIATTEKAEKTSANGQMQNFPPGSPLAQMFKQFMGPMQQQDDEGPRHALGSGFIINADGTIVTNFHVIKGAKKITVTLEDGSSYPATVKGGDEKTDLAVLKIDAKKPLPYLAWGDSDKADVGDWVIAVGNPYGLGGTVTAGIVSAHGRNINSGPYDDFIQIDAPINPGNSGGPLFNQQGQVIGIDSAIYTPNGGSVGIGFAIPSDLAKSVVAQLVEHGSVERGWLGIEMQPLTETLAKAMGRSDTNAVLVDKVTADSPAAKAGLKQGDLVTQYDGKAIKNPREFAMAVANTRAGDKVTLDLVRDGKPMTVDVTIEKLKADKVASDARSDGDTLGLALAPLTQGNRDQLGLDDTVHGALVDHVAPDSRAADSGLKAGDVIEKVGDNAVSSPHEAAEKIHAAENDKKQAVPLLVMRDGTTYYVALQLAEG